LLDLIAYHLLVHMTASRANRIRLRYAEDGEKQQLNFIRHKAWEIAYHHIYNQNEIKDYFLGNSKEGRTWSFIPIQHELNIICEVDDIVAAYASFGWTPDDKGELKSLYVLPQFWNQGIGTQLWNHITDLCHKEQVKSIDIWVLENARSSEFYLSKGCIKVDQGDYYIGEHLETALCYRWSQKDST